MGLPISFVICGFIAALTVYMAFYYALQIRREEKTDFQEVLRRAENLMATLKKLPELQGKERLTACRAIAEDMCFHSVFLVRMVWGPYASLPEQESEIGKLMLAAIREARELNWQLRCFLLQLRFRPSRVKDCRRRIRRATVQHIRMWKAFLRLWRVQYPDEFRNLTQLADS